MDDIRSPQDNEAAADYITQQVRDFTADPACALHVSIAGGRKTMGFYLGYALSLYVRAQDRLSHVLVSDPYESSWDFFYPTPYSRVLQTRDGKLADTTLAPVTLAQIPFVSLRHGLPQALLDGLASFNDTVAAARAALAPPHLLVDLRGKRIVAAGKEIELPPAELALLAVFARETLNGGAPLSRNVHKYQHVYLLIILVIYGIVALLRGGVSLCQGKAHSISSCQLPRPQS